VRLGHTKEGKDRASSVAKRRRHWLAGSDEGGRAKSAGDEETEEGGRESQEYKKGALERRALFMLRRVGLG
jgi:hypothetical protein